MNRPVVILPDEMQRTGSHGGSVSVVTFLASSYSRLGWCYNHKNLIASYILTFTIYCFYDFVFR